MSTPGGVTANTTTPTTTKTTQPTRDLGNIARVSTNGTTRRYTWKEVMVSHRCPICTSPIVPRSVSCNKVMFLCANRKCTFPLEEPDMQQYVIPSDLVTVVHKVSPTSSRASTPSRPVTPVSSGDVQSNNTENAQQPLNKRRRQDVSPPNTITFNRQHLPHTTNPTSPVDIHSASINTSSDSHPPSITPPPIIDLVSPPTIHSPQPNRNPPLNVAGNPPPIHTSSQPPPIVSNTCPLPPPSPSSDALLDLFSLPPDDLILAL